MTDLRMERATRGSSVIVSVVGEIDLTNTELFGEGLAEAASERAGTVAIDLSQVLYMDSAGIRVVFDLAATLEASRQNLVIVVPETSSLRRLFTITEMEQVARIVATVDEVVDAEPTNA